MRYQLALLIILFLPGCRQQSKKTADADKSGAPRYKIIYLEDYYSSYLKAAKDYYFDRDKIYQEKIAEPILKNYFSKSEYADLVKENMSDPIQDTNGLTKAISELKENKVQIEDIISVVLMKCSRHLKNDSLTFYILPAIKATKEIINKMGGVFGLTAGSKQILLTIDPEIHTWKEVLEYTVAHEFNHAYWTKNNFNNFFKWTLLKYLIFEGKADLFAHLLYPEVKAPWTIALSEKEKIELWNKIKPGLKSENTFLIGEVMFGSKNYPFWGGYTLGFDILRTALKNHPELAETDWTNVDADEIVKMSNYK
jgi:uncharacterized protein YjaZ